MLKTILSATVLALACFLITGCGGGDDVGSVDDYGGEREVDSANRVSAPGAGGGDDEIVDQTQSGGGG